MIYTCSVSYVRQLKQSYQTKDQHFCWLNTNMEIQINTISGIRMSSLRTMVPLLTCNPISLDLLVLNSSKY